MIKSFPSFPTEERFAGPDVEHYTLQTDNMGFCFSRQARRRHDGRMETVFIVLSNAKTGRRLKINNGVL